MINKLLQFTKRPELYAQSTSDFWEDEYISKGILETHLNPTKEDFAKDPVFIKKSVDWICSVANQNNHPSILVMGCGPGIYTEQFCLKGYQVTGMDFSRRSIDYAKASANKKQLSIQYNNKKFIELDAVDEYDIITILYDDFGSLNEADRSILLKKAYQALKVNGMLIIDVFTPFMYESMNEFSEWHVKDGGFWSFKPNLCLTSFLKYPDSNTLLYRAIVVTDDSVECYHIWNHAFTSDEINTLLKEIGFAKISIYKDVTGTSYTPDSATLCAVAVK